MTQTPTPASLLLMGLQIFRKLCGCERPAVDNDAARKLDEYILQHEKLREYGMTGAMHQYGILHGLKLFEVGREEYLKELAKDRGPEDFFEFELDEAFLGLL